MVTDFAPSPAREGQACTLTVHGRPRLSHAVTVVGCAWWVGEGVSSFSPRCWMLRSQLCKGHHCLCRAGWDVHVAVTICSLACGA